MSLYLVNQCYNGFPCFVINCFEIWKPFIWPDPLTFSVVHGLLSWGKIVLFHWLDHFQLVFLGSIFNRQSFLPPFFPLMLKKIISSVLFFHVFNVLICFFLRGMSSFVVAWGMLSSRLQPTIYKPNRPVRINNPTLESPKLL